MVGHDKIPDLTDYTGSSEVTMRGSTEVKRQDPCRTARGGRFPGVTRAGLKAHGKIPDLGASRLVGDDEIQAWDVVGGM